MTTLKFSTQIKATKEKVWDKLWNDKTYGEWTAPFCEGSYAVSDWKEGSNIDFLTPDGHGMFSMIEKNDPSNTMTFKHLGEIKNGVKEEKDWTGARESYSLSETNGITTVEVALDGDEKMAEYFNGTFPKALAVLKEISEK